MEFISFQLEGRIIVFITLAWLVHMAINKLVQTLRNGYPNPVRKDDPAELSHASSSNELSPLLSEKDDPASLPSTSAESSSPHAQKYDVFLSFRGSDTRRGITSDLYVELEKRGIKTFMDAHDLDVGSAISPSLLTAIEKSKFAIVVLSPNYATSPWCLEELTKIVQCMDSEDRILPLFYDVDPSDVRHQKKSYEVAFKEHEKKARRKTEKLNLWRDALRKVANLSGWDSRIFKTDRELVTIIVKSVWSRLWPLVPPEEISLIATPDYEAFDSRTSTAKEVMDELKRPGTYMIGVYGMGGVGKTTLIKEIYRQAATGEKLFEEVVMVLDLKHNPSIRRIQKEIAEKLGVELSETDTDAGRARHVCNRIKVKKTLVLLDDVWESIDLEAVGLPRITSLKVLLTSRTRLVLSSEMGTQKEFHLDVLGEEESWSLFHNKAGDVVKDPEIGVVATQVAAKCGGLPLLIVTVARSLKNSSLPYWRDTLRQLKRLDGQGLTEKTYSIIEWSYNRLESKELKSVFLLCVNCEFGSGNSICILDLLKYSKGLGFLSNVRTMDEAYDALHSMLEKLKGSCLLLASDSNERVNMHDLVKDVAKYIALRDHMVLSRSHGSELEEWPDNEFSEKCSMISLKECSIPQFPEVLQCQELKLFLLSRTIQSSFQEIPCNFFREMKKLRVLDLTKLSMPSLPPSLQFLISLRTLCLDQCTLGDLSLVGELRNLEILSLLKSKFKQLPKEIGQLTRLRLLDLSGCTELEVISPNVLSSFKRLEQLRMGDSFNKWESEGGRHNVNIEELKHLTQLTVLQIHIPDANILPPNLFTNHKLQSYQVCIGPAWKWTDVNENLNTLKLKLTANNELDQGLIMLLKSTKDLYLDGIEGVNNRILSQLGIQHLKHLHVQNRTDVASMINGKIGFPNLTWLAISGLNDSKFMLSSSMARCLVQLERLQISNCRSMEHIISLEESDEESMGINFFKLQDLELKDLPNLLKFYSRNDTKVQTPPTERLEVEVCTEICEEIAQTDSKGNTHFLFDDKVMFPNLKKLSIHGLANLTTIWKNHFSLEGPNNLETVEINSCESLKCVFPALVATSLQQLRRLNVWDCGGVEEIISNKDQVPLTTPTFVFPRLTYVRFMNLPQLRRFYPGSHASKFPSLVTLFVYRCGQVEIFTKGKFELYHLSTSNRQSLFSLDKESFSNLESLGLFVTENWNTIPLHLFRNLQRLAYSNSSVNSLEKLLGLEELDASNGEIHRVGDGTLPQLTELRLFGMPKLKHLGEANSQSAGPSFSNLEFLELVDCDSLMNLRSSAISFNNLKTLQVRACKGLKYLFSYSMAKILMHLTSLEVVDCEEMIEIVENNEDVYLRSEIEFKRLKHLKLSALPRLQGFCSGNVMLKFSSLETLSLNCATLETFIFAPINISSTFGKEIRETDSKENLESGGVPVTKFLFDKKVELPNLKNLSIYGLTMLTTIWHCELASDSFCKLKDLVIHDCDNLVNIFVPSIIGKLSALDTLLVERCKSLQLIFALEGVDVRERIQDTSTATQLKSTTCVNLSSVQINSCESLKNVFPAWVARNLQKLQTLVVKRSGVEKIVAKEEGLLTTPKFVFPKVTYVLFFDLARLTNFYSGMHASYWPLLNDLRVVKCQKVNIFGMEISSFQEEPEPEHLCNLIQQSLFLIEKDSFPNLEWLVVGAKEFWNAHPFPAALFSKLKFLEMACLASSTSVTFLDLLIVNHEETIFGTSTSTAAGGLVIQQQPQYLHLRKLRLVRMEKLMYLGYQDEEDNSQSAPLPNIPNLEILIVIACGSLRNLTSSTISFKNLTTLEVSCCDKIEYLVTFSIARDLMHLTTLEVENCQKLVTIVGSSQVTNSGSEIAFRKLKHLKLFDLPRLKGFCSKNYVVKLPPLETLSMSNRLKLKLFPLDEALQVTNEEEDTDVEESEALPNN